VKKLLTTVVLLTITGTPVLAQSFAPEYGSGNIVSGANQGGEAAYAQAPDDHYAQVPESHRTRSERLRHVRRLQPSAVKSEDNMRSNMQD
jgi:hypothetical protein